MQLACSTWPALQFMHVVVCVGCRKAVTGCVHVPQGLLHQLPGCCVGGDGAAATGHNRQPAVAPVLSGVCMAHVCNTLPQCVSSLCTQPHSMHEHLSSLKQPCQHLPSRCCLPLADTAAWLLISAALRPSARCHGRWRSTCSLHDIRVWCICSTCMYSYSVHSRLMHVQALLPQQWHVLACVSSGVVRDRGHLRVLVFALP